MDLSTADVFNRTAALPLGRAAMPAAMSHTNAKKWSHFNASGQAPKGAMMAFGSAGSSPSLYGPAHASAM